MTVEIRDMLESDLDAVLALEQTCFACDPWSRELFVAELEEPDRVWIVAIDGDVLVGYAGITTAELVMHLLNLAVHPDHRRAGVARSMVRVLSDRAAQSGCDWMMLEVRASDPVPQALYSSLGLAVIARREGYYSSGEDALVMAGDLLSTPEPVLDPGEVTVLAIETSCDETAAAIMRGGTELLSSVVASQIDFHARFGGVVPEIASRKHTEAIVAVVDEALEQAGMRDFSGIDALAVTHGPGLVGALVVGVAYAKGLAFSSGIPLVGVNHLEGHIFANILAEKDLAPPLLALVVSGGHTSLVHMPAWGEYHTVGQTIDDAAGEAFDKVAKALGLGYPGGPIISKLAAEGNRDAIRFPRALMKSGDYRFSLSGLKTAVINHIRHEREAGREIDLPDLAASFQAAVVDVQVAKTLAAAQELGVDTVCLAGGVAANAALRDALRAALEAEGIRLSVPPFDLCTDNAAMIAAAGHYRFLRGERLALNAEADPALRLDTPATP